MFRLTLAVLLAGTAVAPAQPKAKPVPKAQLVEAAVAKTLPGRATDTYVVLLVTEKPDRSPLRALGAIVDVFTLPARLMPGVNHGPNAMPWFSQVADGGPSWDIEVAVFADRKAAVAGIAAFGAEPPTNGNSISWRLIRRPERLADAIKAADAEQAKLDARGKKTGKLTVTRRPNPEPPAKK